MARASEETRERTDRLDAVGNTTKALTKGYAVGSAALAAFLLFSAYLDKVRQVNPSVSPTGGQVPVNLSDVGVFVGAFIGAMLVFLFSSLAIRAVGRAAGQMIEEVRTQFRNDPGIMQGTSRPDYARAVDISARAALREMIAPGLLAVGNMKRTDREQRRRHHADARIEPPPSQRPQEGDGESPGNRRKEPDQRVRSPDHLRPKINQHEIPGWAGLVR